MSIPFEGFCDQTYAFENKFAAVERCVNFYPVSNETQSERKFRTMLAPSPVNKQFSSALPVPAPFNQPCRGMIEWRGRVFGVNGSAVYEIDSTGLMSHLGNVVNDGQPVSMTANGTGQIFIASAGLGYVWSIELGLVKVTDPEFLGASYATFQDGYVLVITPNSNQFQISGNDTTPLGDATLWDAANVSVQAGQADLLKAIISRREYIRLMGSRRSQVYQNVGNSGVGNFPFSNYNDTFIENGIAAPFSLCDTGVGLIWIGESDRGIRAAWLDKAFQPQRISTYAIEQQWASYSTIGDAVAFTYVWMGHLMYQVSFPTADKTWVYDDTESSLVGRPVWHERTYTDYNGQPHARSEQFHCFAFGKHLVGSTGIDGNPGAVYQYYTSKTDALYDCGVDSTGAQAQMSIVRDRICPHVWNANKRVIYNRLEFEMDRGMGLDGGVYGSDPVILLRWSNDGGNTWGTEQQVPVGQIGQFSKRVLINRLGYGRDRVFWVRCADPVYWSFVAAMLDVQECAS